MTVFQYWLGWTFVMLIILGIAWRNDYMQRQLLNAIRRRGIHDRN